MATTRGAALALALGTMGVAAVRSVRAVAPPPAPLFTRDVRPVLTSQCLPCHGKDSPSAGLSFAKLTTEAAARGDLGDLEKAMGRVMAGEMPPGKPLPMAQRKAFQAWVENALADQCRLADPGRVTLRRLNREEYDNTVDDLLGTTARPADDFPGDDVGNGFDNQGDVLTTSPLLMEKVLDSAERLAREAVMVPRKGAVPLDPAEFKGGRIEPADGGATLVSGGVCSQTVKGLTAGSYQIRVTAAGQLAGPEPPVLRLWVDDKPLQEFTIADPKPKAYEATATLTAGAHKIGVEFTNDYYDAQTKADRNVRLNAVELNPLGPTAYSEAHRRIVPFEPAAGQEEATARKFLAGFAARAFRRPATPQDLDRLMAVYQAGAKGGSFDEGMRLAVQACLSSPRFLYRLEQDPQGSAGKTRALDSFEVASRLSYFLWSSMPDATLFDLAAKGQLVRPTVVRQQVLRMIQDPKAQALADNFAGQWLNLRKLQIVEFDPKQYAVTPELRRDMATETKRFFLGVLRNGRPITDFIDAKYTYLNGRMAEHYGIAGVTGDEWRKVALTGPRGGVLTQASVLTVTSNPTRTSPTKRGKWVLENIFGTPPPPPPPGVSDIPDEKHKIEGMTLRQLMEEHRKNPSCAVCHQKMDPIGFGMENFDPIGRWRERTGNFPIDASGTLPSGKSFNGPTELKEILLSQKDQFARALSEKLLSYALGRGVDFKDKCALDAAVAATKGSGYRLDALIAAVATSDPFLKRKAP